MIKNTYESFFAALSGNRRLEIIQQLLLNSPQNVTEIAAATGIEQSMVSRNLSQLLACEFVHLEVRGKHRYYSLNEETVVQLFKLIDRHIEKFCLNKCGCCVKEHLPNSCSAGRSK